MEDRKEKRVSLYDTFFYFTFITLLWSIFLVRYLRDHFNIYTILLQCGNVKKRGSSDETKEKRNAKTHAHFASKHNKETALVDSFAAAFRVVTQHSSRDDPKNGCEGDYGSRDGRQ